MSGFLDHDTVSRYKDGDVYGRVETTALETQVAGDHYKNLKIQPVEFIHANCIPYLEGNVIKYVVRHASKNGEADIRKAIHYLQIILELEYGKC
jgi:Protein of unknwon function (DUF3310)